MGAVLDITHTLGDGLAVWPGDTPFTFSLAWKRSDGQSVNVGAVTTTVHAGTHADAPFHFSDDGATIDALDPAVYVGAAVVVDVAGRETITAADLADLPDGVPRVLLRTGGWPDPGVFPETIPVLAPDAIERLSERGVVLVGLDVPSVDAIDSTTLPNHHALAARGIHILESLKLDGVEPGVYELIALPLKIANGDGSPVRAILISRDRA